MATLSDLGALMAIDRKRKFVRQMPGLSDEERASLLKLVDAEQARLLAQGSLPLEMAPPGPAVQAGASPQGRSSKG